MSSGGVPQGKINTAPKLCKQGNRAFVTIPGSGRQRKCLGTHGTPEAENAYKQFLTAWAKGLEIQAGGIYRIQNLTVEYLARIIHGFVFVVDGLLLGGVGGWLARRGPFPGSWLMSGLVLGGDDRAGASTALDRLQHDVPRGLAGPGGTQAD